MRALVYSDWGVLKVKEVPTPKIKNNEALVRVEACGICGSELETFKSRSPRRTPPLILGHEFCGIIESVGDRAIGLKPGQKAVINSVISCGKCYPCLRGDTHLCTSRQVFGMHRPGAIAEYVAAPADHIYSRPETLPPVLGALAEPLANGVHVMNILPKIDNPSIAVIGAGAIGLMALQAALALRKARILVADINDERLLEAKKLGAETTINPKSANLIKACIEFSAADGLDICIDAVGASETKRQSLAAVRPGGVCVWIGLYNNEMKLTTYDVTLPEKKIFGTYSGTREDFECAIRLLSNGDAKGGDWVKVFSMKEAVGAFERMLTPNGNDIKAVILPGE